MEENSRFSVSIRRQVAEIKLRIAYIIGILLSDYSETLAVLLFRVMH